MSQVENEFWAEAVKLLERHHVIRYVAGANRTLDEETEQFFNETPPHPSHILSSPHPSDGLPGSNCLDCGVNFEDEVLKSLLPCDGYLEETEGI